MASLRLSGIRSVALIGAHPDDLEIAAGGLMLSLARAVPGLRASYVVMTGAPERRAEAEKAAAAFLPGADLSIACHDLPDGRLPAHWSQAKEAVEIAAREGADLVLAPWSGDAHQDHRLLGTLVPTAFRNSLVLHYEIPKWDGDLGRPQVYVPLSDETARRKVQLLNECFRSQHARDWWDDEVFLGLARIRGVECRARYAEAFHASKLTLALA